MAKHKKKKFPPTPDPKDSKKKDEPKEDKPENPPTEKKDLPKTEPVKTDYDLLQIQRKIDKLFWLRVGLAVMGGIAATFLFDSIEGEERRWTSIVFMIFIFIVSIVIAKSMNFAPPRSDRKKLFTTGIGSFVFLYLFMWIVSYTLVNITNNETSSIIPFP